MSYPSSIKCVAKEWRNVCRVAGGGRERGVDQEVLRSLGPGVLWGEEEIREWFFLFFGRSSTAKKKCKLVKLTSFSGGTIAPAMPWGFFFLPSSLPATRAEGSERLRT